MSTPAINEGCSAWLQVDLKDKAGALSTPTAVRYRIDCRTTGAIIKDWTAAAAQSSQEIALSATDHVLQSPRNIQEVRRVTVEATYADASDKVTAKFDYALVNMMGL